MSNSKTPRFLLGLAAVLFALTAFSSFAFAEDATKGPVWRVWTARVNEDKMGKYANYLQKVYSQKLAAWKAAGLLTDYMIVFADPQTADDWNVAFYFQYKNAAALDGPEEPWDKIGKKVVDGLKDPELKLADEQYPQWRKFTGWNRQMRELVMPK